MEIKILNRNSNRVYSIDEGMVYTTNKNETLDSAVVTISNVPESLRMLNIEPYDIALIIDNDDNDWKYFCIDTYTETMLCVNPKLYRYEIHLFSQTKLLEGIVLPNLKITKMPGINRKIYYYINQYLTEYCPKIRVSTGENTYSYEYKWDWSGLEDKFTRDCPEMQWNTPTLREVLNDLMMVQDCIPIIKTDTNNGVLQGIIGFMDLTETSDMPEVAKNKINYVTKSKSSEDYVSELQVKLENVTNNVNNVDNVVTRSEYFPLCSPEDDATLTTQNMTIKTQYPIYNLKGIYLMFPAKKKSTFHEGGTSTRETTSKWYEQNLMNLPYKVPDTVGIYEYFSIVDEYENWLTKKSLFSATVPSNFYQWRLYREWCLYYTRGNNEIFNLNNVRKFLFVADPLYQNLCWQIVYNRRADNETFESGDEITAPEWDTILFKVEYETLEGCLFRASKGEEAENSRIIIDNQTNSYIDSYSQGFLEYQKANRLGNEQLQINARYDIPYTGHLIEIGDIYDDSVIYQCQYQYFKDHIEINAIATKNYVLREYFTGVKSKIRSWAIVKGSEALTRHDLLKYYCEFSYNEHKETSGLEDLDDNEVISYLITPLSNYNAAPTKYCFVRTQDSNDNYYPPLYLDQEGTYYSMDLMKRVIGTSLVFTFEFLDNYWAGKQFDPDYINYSNLEIHNGLPKIKSAGLIDLINDIVQGSTGVPTQQYRYTDNNGENVKGEIVLTDGFRAGPSWAYTKWDGNAADDDDSLRFLDYVYRKPRIWTTMFKSDTGVPPIDYERIRIRYEIKKDSQEITNISTQFEFCSDTTDICVGREFLNRQKAISAVNNSNDNYRLLKYNSDKYNFRNPNNLPENATPSRYSVAIGYQRPVDYGNLNAKILIALKGMTFKTEDYDSRDDAIQAALEYSQNLAKDSCFYLNDGSENEDNILLAFNNLPDNRISYVEIEQDVFCPCYTLYLNILKTRNKNIYNSNNYYQINRKL